MRPLRTLRLSEVVLPGWPALPAEQVVFKPANRLPEKNELRASVALCESFFFPPPCEIRQESGDEA